ncbi:uncharacterized protein LOC116262857 isoform X1 [Nymphaea colorata]|nr:uncharacterized protein LOC116262857 isoform X1 [Nymphaea colorata]
MDWFFIQENDDEAVPGTRGAQNEANGNYNSSPECWSQWISDEGSPNRVSFAPTEKLTEELVGGQCEGSLSSVYTCNGRKQFSDEVLQTSYANNEDLTAGAHFEQQASEMVSYHQMINLDLLSPSSSELLVMNCDEKKSSALHEHGLLGDKKDYQFQYLYQTDDIFQHLVSGGDIHEDKNHVSFPNMSPIVESSSTQSENFLSDMLVDSLSLMNDSSNITDVLNYWKSSTTSLETANSPDIWEEFNMEFSDHPSCSTLDLSDSTENAPTKTTFMRNSHGNASSFQRCITRASMPTDLQRFGDNEDTKADDEGSLEATVLYELETSMAQLNAKTRICFRDALYRLARNSWPQTAAKVAVDDICINSNGERELETNVIDRAIAKLLFNNVGHDTAQFSFPSSHGKKSVPKTARFHQKRRLATHPSVAEHEDSQEELSVTTINSF